MGKHRTAEGRVTLARTHATNHHGGGLGAGCGGGRREKKKEVGGSGAAARILGGARRPEFFLEGLPAPPSLPLFTLTTLVLCQQGATQRRMRDARRREFFFPRLAVSGDARSRAGPLCAGRE